MKKFKDEIAVALFLLGLLGMFVSMWCGIELKHLVDPKVAVECFACVFSGSFIIMMISLVVAFGIKGD